MRHLDPTFDPDVVSAIDARLDGVAAEHGVRVVWAVESGSRAWGFPSPDSDYDCRFFYVRPRASYADPWPPRDVIETPLDAVLDVNGWDLVKAARLAVRGNATIGEWLRSPFVYAGDPDFRDDLLALVADVADRDGLRRHYLHVGRQHWLRNGLAPGIPVPLKGVLYAVRPAATLHWMAAHPTATTPPMNLGELLAEAAPPPAVVASIEELVATKSRTRELGTGELPQVLGEWMIEVFAANADAENVPLDPGARDRARVRFRELVDRWAPAG